MAKVRTFISFDYDHDENLKNLLVGQARNVDSPFDIVDMSIKEPISENWINNARTRIKGCEVVIVICGEYTDTAKGVAIEVKLARDERVPYFLLAGYPDRDCKKPSTALDTDKLYKWTWDNLKNLINGSR